MKAFVILSFLDEQGTRLWTEKCRTIAFRLLCWWMQYFYVWNHALFFKICWTRMSFVSSNKKWSDLIEIIFSSFNGETFKIEPSTQFPHENIDVLGLYQNSPFVTGHGSSENGLKTEILNYGSGEWEQAGDYPFSSGDRYVSNDFYGQLSKSPWIFT